MSKLIISSVLINVRNVRNFSGIACAKKRDSPSGSYVAVNQQWSKPVKKSSQFNYFCPTNARWCSTGSGLEALTNSISRPPNEATTSLFENLPSIPPPPEILPPVQKIIELAKNGEQTLEQLGLGGWWPSGIFEQALFAAHVNLGLPWWGTIVLGACLLRCIMFPLSIKTQQAAGQAALYMPQITEAHEKMTEARLQDDPYLVYKYSKQIQELQKKGGNPLKSFQYVIVQLPFAVSFFTALRHMCSAPVESFKTGGALWFTDLTITDAYYGLPILCALGTFGLCQLSRDSFVALKFGPYIPYAAAPVVFLTCVFFSNAIGVYWVTSTALNCIQNVILKNPSVREKFHLPPRVKTPLKKEKKKSEGFIKDFKKNMENNRIAREVEDRYRLDAIAFEKAGKEPLRKTYKIDPTKTLSKM